MSNESNEAYWADDVGDDNDEVPPFDLDDGGDEPDTRPACEFVTGAAGTGKSFEINRRLDDAPGYGLVAATTGIAAINLGEGVTTINAALGYFDTQSLVDAYIRGRLVRRIRKIADDGYRNLIIDEVSMMDARQLDTITRAVTEYNALKGTSDKKQLGIVLTGDFMQLPPVKAQWAFEAESWPMFDANTTRLLKCWRQDDPAFQSALSAVRRGDGHMGASLLAETDATFAQNNNLDYPGTTLVSRNEDVERFNWACHSRLQGRATQSESVRWGKQKGEWKLVPDVLQLKIGAFVMILANKRDAWMSDRFLYVNGDCGWVKDYDEATNAYTVELKRGRKAVRVEPVTRRNEQKERPSDEIEAAKRDGKRGPFWDEARERWVLGEASYVPMRLAYATTVHKSQGLSLDSVQIDLTNAFFGSPAMAYVALSRCRSAAGLRIIGTPELLTKRVSTDPKVMRFL